MSDFVEGLNPVFQAFLATSFTWALTAFGAAFVFFTKNINRKMLDGMLGFASGIMIAASFWSLLVPAIEISEKGDLPSWFPAAIGFLSGAVFLRIVDKLLPHLHMGLAIEEAEGMKTSWRRTTLLILAVTLHNIPEGLAVGVAFGAAASGLESATLSGAIALAVGIGLQNFPEGMAISMPLRMEGMSGFRSFWYGQLSAVVEPVAAIFGATAVIMAQSLLPYALGFAAGAMIFVVVEQLIPESQNGGNSDIATLGTISGFLVMMILDVGFG